MNDFTCLTPYLLLPHLCFQDGIDEMANVLFVVDMHHMHMVDVEPVAHNK